MSSRAPRTRRPSGLQGGGSLGAAGVSLNAAGGAILGVKPNCPDPDDPRCEPKGGDGVVFEVDATLGDSGCTDANNNSWVSTSPGLTGKSNLGARWKRFELIVTTSGPGNVVLKVPRARVR